MNIEKTLRGGKFNRLLENAMPNLRQGMKSQKLSMMKSQSR